MCFSMHKWVDSDFAVACPVLLALQAYVQYVGTAPRSALHSAAALECSVDLLLCRLPFEQVQRLSLRRDSFLEVRGWQAQAKLLCCAVLWVSNAVLCTCFVHPGAGSYPPSGFGRQRHCTAVERKQQLVGPVPVQWSAADRRQSLTGSWAF